MTTLPIRAPIELPFAGFARVKLFCKALIEVFADAQQQANAAHRRYPFAEW